MKKNRGFSIIEFLIAVIVAFFILAGIIMVWQSVEKAWLIERINSKIIGELETFAERIKKEISGSDGNSLFFCPEGELVYEAISFPVAIDNSGDGFIEVDSEGNVIWDRTVIYHVFVTPEGQTQLRQTVFDPRLDLSKSERQRQLDEVVANGGAVVDSTPNCDNAATRFLFTCGTDILTPIVLAIEPSALEFDGYSPATARSQEISFGSTTLTAGDHYITFRGAGTSQTGYELGIDSFCLSPSGCGWEAEECGIHSDSGKVAVNEDMVSYGSWSGNRHLEYQAGDDDDFINLNFYYDEWIETNFYRCSPSAVLIDYSQTDGDGGTSGVNDYIVRLDGYGETWNVLEQVGDEVPELAFNIDTPETGRTYRNVIVYQVIDTGGSGVRFKFKNCSQTNGLHIESASLFERSEGPDGITSSKKIITFSGNPSVIIPQANSLWSDWINLLDIGNFTKDVDYLVSFFVTGANPIGMSSWQGPGGGTPQAYYLESDTDYSEVDDWPDTALQSDKVYALESIEVSYYASGTLTSQIYDTQLENPAYSILSWNIVKDNYGDYDSGGLGANLRIKVRSNDIKAALLSDNDWSDELTIDTQSAVTGTADISSITGGRYVQFQAGFSSQPAAGSYNYLKSSVLKSLKIRWPGESTEGGTSIVDLSGYITTRPDYGKFSIEVDGKSLTKGLELSLTLTKDIFGIGPITRSVTTEIEPRNTGK